MTFQKSFYTKNWKEGQNKISENEQVYRQTVLMFLEFCIKKKPCLVFFDDDVQRTNKNDLSYDINKMLPSGEKQFGLGEQEGDVGKYTTISHSIGNFLVI